MSWRKRFSVLFILRLLVSTFVAVGHHHDNTADDHDCPICLVSHHQQATGQATVAFDATPFVTGTTYAIPAAALVEQTVISLFQNRAPPV